MRDPNAIVQNYVVSPFRSARTLSGTFTEKQLETTTSRAELESIYLKRLQTAIGNEPIRVTSVNIRGIAVGDQQYRADLAAREKTLADQRSRGEILDEQLRNLDKEQELARRVNEFQRTQDELKAQSEAKQMEAKLAPYRGLDWRVIAVVLGRQIQVTPQELQAPVVPAAPR